MQSETKLMSSAELERMRKRTRSLYEALRRGTLGEGDPTPTGEDGERALLAEIRSLEKKAESMDMAERKTAMGLRRIKRVRGYAAHARLLAEFRWTADGELLVAGWIGRQEDIPSPYASGSTHCVMCWGDRPVIVVETKHRQYDVFHVAGVVIHKTEEAVFEAMAERSGS